MGSPKHFVSFLYRPALIILGINGTWSVTRTSVVRTVGQITAYPDHEICCRRHALSWASEYKSTLQHNRWDTAHSPLCHPYWVTRPRLV